MRPVTCFDVGSSSLVQVLELVALSCRVLAHIFIAKLVPRLSVALPVSRLPRRLRLLASVVASLPFVVACVRCACVRVTLAMRWFPWLLSAAPWFDSVPAGCRIGRCAVGDVVPYLATCDLLCSGSSGARARQVDEGDRRARAGAMVLPRFVVYLWSLFFCRLQRRICGLVADRRDWRIFPRFFAVCLLAALWLPLMPRIGAFFGAVAPFLVPSGTCTVSFT